MTWEEAQALMESRGYRAFSVAKSPGSGETKVLQMSKTTANGIRLHAEITTNNPDCEPCWQVRIFYNYLKRYMRIDSYPFSMQRKDFGDIEKDVIAYAELCRNSNIDNV